MKDGLPPARAIGWDPDDPPWEPPAPNLFDTFPAPTGTTDTPAAARPSLSAAFVHQLATMAVEVLAGRRPVVQLAPWLDEATYTSLARRWPTTHPVRLRLSSVDFNQSHPTRAEVWLRVAQDQRFFAMAFQLEYRQSGWQCRAWDYRLEDLRPSRV